MQRIDVQAFKGMAPRQSPALLENEQGTHVVGQMTSGELRPWNIPAYIQPCLPDTESIYLAQGGDWLTWDEVVNVHPSIQANDAFGRIYYTRESGGLFVISPLDDYTEFRAGVPQPPSPPTVAVTGSGSGTVEDRVYAYSYVNGWGEEGPLSEPSEFHDWQPGKTVTLSNFAPPPLGFKAVLYLRVYRMAVGDTGADWFLVEEIDGDSETFVDAVSDELLRDAAKTQKYDLPQGTARGLVPVGGGVFATFSGNEIAFSEPYLPYAWPDGYRLTVAGSIVALGVVGNAVVVLTNQRPTYIYTAHSSASRLPPEDFWQTPLAEVSPCVSPRGVVSTEFGVIFPAPDGLRVLQGEGASRLISEKLVTEKEWVAIFDPLNLRAGYFDSYYFGWSGDKGFAYHLRTDVLTWTGMSAQAVHSDGLGLFVAIDGGIWAWNAEKGLLRAEFRSKVYRYPKPVNFAAVRIDSNLDPIWEDLRDFAISIYEANLGVERDVLDLAGEEILGQSVAGDNLFDLPYDGGGLGWHSVMVWADGELRYDGRIDRLGYARLPAGFLAREWQFEIRSHSYIKQVTLGTSTRAIAGVSR